MAASRQQLEWTNAALDVRVNDLARANGDLRNLFDSTHIATVFLDIDFRVRSFTPAATDIFELDDSDIGHLLCELESLISYPELNLDICQALKKLAMVEREVASSDGRYFVVRIHPYRDTDDRIAGAVLNLIDVTDTVKAETALRESENRLKTLLAELQHRVRNTLAVVKSITARTADASSSVDEMATHLAGRLDAFARVQAAVTRNPDAGVDLAALVSDELLAHAAYEGEQLGINGPSIALRPKAAESVSLALHELATNAVKHGALMSKQGRIDISWRLQGEGDEASIDFKWAESGVDGAPAKAARHGFGVELLTRILPYDLGAKTDLRFKSDGISFTMQLPVKHLAAAPGRAPRKGRLSLAAEGRHRQRAAPSSPTAGSRV